MSFLHVALLEQCTGRTQVSRGYCIVPLLRQYLCHVVLYPFSADVLAYIIQYNLKLLVTVSTKNVAMYRSYTGFSWLMYFALSTLCYIPFQPTC